MPQYSPITIAGPKTYAVTGIIGNNAGYRNGGTTFRDAESFVISRRSPSSNQSTRKSSARLTKPLVDECAETCTVKSRGSVLATVDFTCSVDSTLAEREQVYDDFIALLGDADVRTAFVNNEAFWG